MNKNKNNFKPTIAKYPSDLTGLKFGDWTVKSKSNHTVPSSRYANYWDCVCKCRYEKPVSKYNLLRGESTRCLSCRGKEETALRNKKGKGKSKPIHDLTGKVFGAWVVIGKVDGYEAYGNRNYICVCVCGTERVVWAPNLLRGRSKSCGCQWKPQTKHGRHKSPEYEAWHGMKQRCSNPKSYGYKWYGALGISYCEAWESFDNFFKDMGPRPSKEFSIDRINPYGNYEPGNCRWASRKAQAANTRKQYDKRMEKRASQLRKRLELPEPS